MPLLYQPLHARVGDVIPFYEDGECRSFYLKNWNHYFGVDKRHGWHLLKTRDHIHFDERPVGIEGGTGSVIKVNGIYHVFFCKFEEHPQRQYVWHAISSDLEHWTELPGEAFGPDPALYQLTDWRDPHVFWNDQFEEWWMVLCAKAIGSTSRTGCVALCTSRDLSTWACRPPLYAPGESMSGYECPDLFQMGEWWYLIFSQYTDRIQTVYRMSHSPDGPWRKPMVDSFDGRAFYAAKTGFDGNRRLLHGWHPTKTQNHWQFSPKDWPGSDYNTWDWGGCLVTHELWQMRDGRLGVRPLRELIDRFQMKNELKWVPMTGRWTFNGATASAEAEQGYASMLSLNDVPESCLLEMAFSFEAGTRRIALALQVDEAFARGYYFYFEPDRQRVQFKSALRMTEAGGWTFPHDVELERPLTLEPGRMHKLRLIMDGTVMRIYVDDEVALTARGYDLRERKFGLAVDNGAARFEILRLQTL